METSENRVEDDYKIHLSAKCCVFPVYLINEKFKKVIVGANNYHPGFVLVSGPAIYNRKDRCLQYSSPHRLAAPIRHGISRHSWSHQNPTWFSWCFRNNKKLQTQIAEEKWWSASQHPACSLRHRYLWGNRQVLLDILDCPCRWLVPPWGHFGSNHTELAPPLVLPDHLERQLWYCNSERCGHPATCKYNIPHHFWRQWFYCLPDSYWRSRQNFCLQYGQ